MIFEVAHQMGLIPLVWVLLLLFRGRKLGAEWFWLASAFAVSWLADTAAHWVNPWFTSPVYLVSQASIVAFVFISRREAITLTAALVVTGIGAAVWRGFEGPDVLLHTVAWLSVAGIIYPLWQLGRLRGSLLVYFALGWLFWMGYVFKPGWTSWALYQSVRLIGIALFCWAATSPLPQFKILQPVRNITKG